MSRAISLFLAFDRQAGRASVRIYEGEAARRQLAANLREEARCQEQKRKANN